MRKRKCPRRDGGGAMGLQGIEILRGQDPLERAMEPAIVDLRILHEDRRANQAL
jgi:hypothetical protein